MKYKKLIYFLVFVPLFLSSCSNNEAKTYTLDKKEILVNQEFKPFKELSFNEETFEHKLLFVKALNMATISGSGIDTIVSCDTACDFFLNIYFVNEIDLKIKSIYSIEIVVMEL